MELGKSYRFVGKALNSAVFTGIVKGFDSGCAEVHVTNVEVSPQRMHREDQVSMVVPEFYDIEALGLEVVFVGNHSEYGKKHPSAVTGKGGAHYAGLVKDGVLTVTEVQESDDGDIELGESFNYCPEYFTNR